MIVKCPFPGCGQLLLDGNVNVHTIPKHGVRYKVWVRKKRGERKRKTGLISWVAKLLGVR